MFPRKKTADEKEHSEEYLFGFSQGLNKSAEMVQWADAYISLLERRVRDLSERQEKSCYRCGQCEKPDNQRSDSDVV